MFLRMIPLDSYGFLFPTDSYRIPRYSYRIPMDCHGFLSIPFGFFEIPMDSWIPIEFLWILVFLWIPTKSSGSLRTPTDSYRNSYGFLWISMLDSFGILKDSYR